MRLRSQNRTTLLSLPDEVLSPILFEAMWATTTKPSSAVPDLLSYQRRLVSHPSIHRSKAAFVGQICGRLKRIAQAHLQQPRIWGDPTARVELSHYCYPLATAAPASLRSTSIKAIAFSQGQAIFLPQLPSATLEQLSDLSITCGSGHRIEYSDKVLQSIGSCKQLQNLVMRSVEGSASGTAKLFADLASIPTLETLAVEELRSLHGYQQPVSLVLGQSWNAPLVRLEVIFVYGVSWRRFVQLMGKVAATLQVAIFHDDDYQLSSTSESVDAEVADFPELWRLDIGFGLGSLPEYRRQHAVEDSTPAGHQQVAECSPIAVWKAAPCLEYLECSERITLTTRRELDKVAELRRGMKRLRIKLETWEGEKGTGWSTDKNQEVVVG